MLYENGARLEGEIRNFRGAFTQIMNLKYVFDFSSSEFS